MSPCTMEIPSCVNVVLPINLNGPRSHWLGQRQTPNKDKDLRHLPGQSYTLAWKCCPNLLSKFTGQEPLGLPFILCFHQHIFFKLIVSFLNLFYFFFGCASGMRDHSSHRDQTHIPCTGSMESSPLSREGSHTHSYFSSSEGTGWDICRKGLMTTLPSCAKTTLP